MKSSKRTPISRKSFLGPLAMIGLLLIPTVAISHEGHPDSPGTESALPAEGPVRISADARKNLDLRTEAAELRSVQEVFTTVGYIAPIPKRSGTVSTRISGRVTKLLAEEGERVSRGQPMAEVESRQLGSPPPRVTYGSPIAGVVTDSHVVIGESVEPDRHLFEITDLREVYAIAHVFEGQIGLVRTGAKVRVHVGSFPNEVFEGTIDRTGGALDRETGSLKVFVRLANPDERLLPGMTASMSMVTAESDLGVTVPKSAVLGEMGRYFAFVEGEDPLTFERRSLVLGLSDDRYQEVLEGILPGEEVVVRGNYQLQYVPASPVPENSGKETAAAEADEESPSRKDAPLEQETIARRYAPWLLALGGASVLVVFWLIRRARRPGASSGGRD